MSVHRVMGTEVEYGISVQGQPTANPMLASTQVVNAWANAGARAHAGRGGTSRRRARCATPAASSSGRDLADSTQLTDEDLGLANVILTNGARLYVDHAHPEYSTPECTGPRDVVVWDKAGELVMQRAAALASQLPNNPPLLLYKNNVDNKGASYGAHENYLMDRATPVRRHRGAPDPVLRHPPGRAAAPAGWAAARTAASQGSRSASAPTTSRSRSGWRPRSSGRWSTPATSRTPTRTSTAGCT